jgi:hypothetical protein
LSFYARGDSSSANNAALNVKNTSQQPTVQLTFDSGPTGDLLLEYNGGANDPDTTVLINGVRYNFKVELTGGLPLNSNKVPDPLEGKQVTVVSVVINGTTQRFFFVTDGSGTMSLMNQFGNGAIALTNANFAPPPVHICFCGGTDILTPTGLRKVETLVPGDLVLNDNGQANPILWIGRTNVSFAEMLRAPERRPICIAAHSIEPGVPFCDLYVSAQHRVVMNGGLVELLVGELKVLVAAKHLVGTIAQSVMPVAAISYHHLLFENHDMVVSNGLVTESVQLSKAIIDGMSPEAQKSISDAFCPDTLEKYLGRADGLCSLKRNEAKVLAARMFANNAKLEISGSDKKASEAGRPRSLQSGGVHMRPRMAEQPPAYW